MYIIHPYTSLTINTRCGYSGGAWGAVRPIKLNQWDAWGAVFFLKSGRYWDKS